MKRIKLLAIGMLCVSAMAQGQDYDHYFQDKTLRLDYILGATPNGDRTVLLDAQVAGII